MKTSRWSLAISLLVLVSLLLGCRERAERGQMVPDDDATSAVTVERVVTGLQEPVSLVFLSSSTWLVAERSAGRIRWVENGRLRPAPFATLSVPNVSGYNEFGLLGLAVDPDYPRAPYVYAFHTVGGAGGRPAGQRIVRFTVRDGRGVEEKTIVANLPNGTRCCHNGGRILFGQDGKLYVTLGDTERPQEAQDYEKLPGKILRYNPDGTIPDDNPLEQQRTTTVNYQSNEEKPVQLTGVRTAVYTIGHRNPFGIAVSPETGDLYITENGPDRNDEINRLVPGDNYGWPEVMGPSNDPRFHQPLWASGATVMAPTGAAFYTGAGLPHFRGNLFFANYNDGRLRRAVFANRDRISSVQVVPEAGANAKLDVAMGKDGNLYFTSLNAIYRLRAR